MKIRRNHLSMILATLIIVSSFGAIALGSGVAKTPKGGQSGTTLSGSVTATATWERLTDFTWDITKTALPASLEMQEGQQDTLHYQLNVTRAAQIPTDVYIASGGVTVRNEGGVATEGLAINVAVQYNSGGNWVTIASKPVDLGSKSKLLPGKSWTYPYNIEYDPVAGVSNYRIAASVTITNHSGSLGTAKGFEEKASFMQPSTYTTVESDKTAVVIDPQMVVPSGLSLSYGGYQSQWQLTGSSVINYTVTVTGIRFGEYTLRNTATLTEADSGDAHQAAVTVPVKVTAPFLTGGVTAIGYWNQTQTYNWTVQKSVTPTTLTLGAAQSGTVTYTITSTRVAESPVNIAGVSGTLTINNTGNGATVGLNIVLQLYKNGTAVTGASQVVTPPTQLGPGQSVTYPYQIQFIPVAGTYEVRAHVTVTNPAASQPTGITPSVSFPRAPVVTYEDQTATLNDVSSVPAGFAASSVQAFPITLNDTGMLTFSATITNSSAAAGTYSLTNTATLTESDSGATRVAAAAVQITVPQPPTGDGAGFTPGYWKNHTKSWSSYQTNQTVTAVFAPVPDWPNTVTNGTRSATLLKALSFNGGNSFDGAVQNLLRQAVASLLNAASVANYPRTGTQIISEVNNVILSGNRSIVLDLASQLDALNTR